MREQSILLLGFFLKNKNKKSAIRTAEDRIAEMFAREGIHTITSSSSRNRLSRLFNSVATVILKRKKYEIAIVPLFGTWPSFLWQEVVTRLLKIFHKKIILVIHGGSIPSRINKGATRFFRSLKRAHVLIAPSSYMCYYFLNKNFKVNVIENPIDLSQYRFQFKEIIRPRIIWMRAFTDIYNPQMAIRVAKKLSEKYPDFEMVMAGKDGPLTQTIKAMVKENGLCDKIIFPGYINMKEKLQFAKDYDIYICTNKIDNAPVSLIEFMSLGLPVVSVNVGGIPYMITDEKNGLLVNENDDEAMFEKICSLIEQPFLARLIYSNAYEYAQRYDEKNVIQKWRDLIAQLENL